MKKTYSQHIAEFNRTLHLLHQSNMDYADLSICASALMIHYGVKYKQPDQLEEEKEYACCFHFNDDVAAYFLDEVNNDAHDRFEVFHESCMQFLDYSGALFAPKVPAASKTVVVKSEPAAKGYAGFTATIFSAMEESFFIDTKNN